MRIGEAQVDRYVEWLGPISTVSALFPTVAREAWSSRARLLAPEFWDPATGAYRAVVQTWVLRVDGLTVLVDTGIGDGRDRPQVPEFSGLDSRFDQTLEDGGVHPDEVDIVVNTHIHYDHVGWNTRWNGSNWIPTFPNARYVVPRTDFETFDPAAGNLREPRSEDERRRFAGSKLVFEDSIRPVADSGQLQLWSDSLDLSPHLRLTPAPGHTPGSSVLWLGGSEQAAFVGDLLHSPLQIELPDTACAFDLDAEQAARSRRQVLDEAADRNALVFPAHFAGAGAAHIRRNGNGFTIGDWAPLPNVGPPTTGAADERDGTQATASQL